MKEPECCHAKLPITKRLMSGISDAPKICSQKQLPKHVQGGICPGGSVYGRQCNVSYLMAHQTSHKKGSLGRRSRDSSISTSPDVPDWDSTCHCHGRGAFYPPWYILDDLLRFWGQFWLHCSSWQSPQQNHEGEVNINWPDVSAINYLTNEMLLLWKWSF